MVKRGCGSGFENGAVFLCQYSVAFFDLEDPFPGHQFPIVFQKVIGGGIGSDFHGGRVLVPIDECFMLRII